jgi:Arc/MetJ-type ribon-helix-helix transcriptional regulator
VLPRRRWAYYLLRLDTLEERMGISEPDLRRFIEEQIATGRHASEDEVVEAALRYYRDAQEGRDEYDAMVRREAERGLADIAAGRYQLVENAAEFHDIFQRKLDQLEADMRAEAAAAKARDR